MKANDLERIPSPFLPFPYWSIAAVVAVVAAGHIDDVEVVGIAAFVDLAIAVPVHPALHSSLAPVPDPVLILQIASGPFAAEIETEPGSSARMD